MATDPAKMRSRRGRIEEKSAPQTAQPLPTSFVAPAGVKMVVIRSTREEIEAGGAMMVQDVQYTSSPPVIGQFEGVGEWYEAHPIIGSVPSLYARLAWGPDDPLVFPVFSLLVFQSRGDWILQIPINGVPSEIDPNKPSSGCSG